MNDGQGSTMVVTVPVTWIPVDLTTQATKSAILSAPNFRRMLSTGMLVLVSDEVAEATMAQAQASKEAARVYSRVQDLAGSIDVANMPKDAVKAQSEADGSVSGMAMQLAMASDLDEDQVLTTLQGNISAMTPQDLKYIAENSRYARVKEYAANQVTA